jgi:cytochrome c oxidase cbb3-type subunit 3
MSQFTSGFWDIYIGVMSLVSIVACAIFLKQQSVRKAVEADTTGHIWDETLQEYNNPMPRWWAWMFYLTVAFSLAYLVFYPGLGSYTGTLAWTQIRQLDDETRAANAQFGPIYDKYAAHPVEEVAKSPEALQIGQKLFLNYCAQCHASDGAGARGFPNLTDMEWLWGGTTDAIKTSIAEGRIGVMPPWGQVLGEEGVKDAAHYVMSLSRMPADSVRAARGKELFGKTCLACHGPEGKGNPAMGAPDLTDKVWLHGSSEAQIIETIAKGRTDQMPAHKDTLSPAKIHLLTAYVYSLARSGVAPHRK